MNKRALENDEHPEEATMLGRITSDSDGKPNETSICLETANSFYALDLSNMTEYFLYPN